MGRFCKHLATFYQKHQVTLFGLQTFRADASIVDDDGDLRRLRRRDAEGEARRERHRWVRDVQRRRQVQVVKVVESEEVWKTIRMWVRVSGNGWTRFVYDEKLFAVEY